ncbi:MAG: T9SS type A sorting domain-containing protein [Bacteroidetes bacterium]|nr:T9SS type A sorting domain-containing protein [Bacteroidota bacterium]
MRKIYLLALSIFLIGTVIQAQVTINVKVLGVSVSSNLDCDAGGSDNSDFLFEFRATDNSPFANSNNSPVAGSIGSCNYVSIPEANGPYTVTPAAPAGASFNPSNGLFFSHFYTCKKDIPGTLSIVWRAYENDDTSTPSTTPVADGQTAPQGNIFNIPTSSGTYTVQYTATSPDAGCPQTYTIFFQVVRSVGSFNPLTINDIDGSVVCTGNTTGTANPTIIGGSGTITYDWSNDGTGDFDDPASLSGLAAGTYTLVVKDALGCTDTSTAIVQSQPLPTALSFVTSTNVMCTKQSYPFAVSLQSGVTYNWSYNSGGMVISGSSTETATLMPLAGAPSGTLNIFAQNSCSVSPTLTLAITVNQTPTLSITGNNTVCDNSTEVLTGSGASTFTWSTGSNSSSVTVGPAGTSVYTLSGTSNGCVGSSTFTMTTIPSPTAQITGPTAAVCPGTTVTATASGNGVYYIWSDGFIGASHTFSNTSTVVYTVTTTYTNSCISQQTYTLNINPTPTISIAGNTGVCDGTVNTYTASGADTYSWSTTSSQPTTSVTVTTPVTLTVIGTNTTTGCSASASQSVTVYPNPVLAVTGNTAVCSGSSTVIHVSGADFYAWSNGATSGTETITPTSTETITIKGTNLTGGCQDSVDVVISVVPKPNITVTGADSICRGQSTVLSATGAANYNWSTSATTSTIAVTPTVTTTYTVSSNNGSCSDTKMHTVTVNPLPAIDFSLGDVCLNDPAFALNATPSGGTYSGTGVTGSSFDPMTAGAGPHVVTYSVTNGHGCPATSQATLTVLVCAGVEELSTAGTSILAFPNPTNGTLNIHAAENIKLVQVADINGRMVKLQELRATETTLDMSDLSEGVYLVKVTLHNGAVKQLRILRN